jgi:hypothetical protein
MVIQIPLGRSGMVGLVDDSDGDSILMHHWHAHWTGDRWYVRREYRVQGTRVRIYLHRDLCDGTLIDHVDGNGLNNQRSNLRPASHSQNLANTSQRRDSRQPYKGIWQRPSGRWAARINNRTIGTFDTDRAAARAYDGAASQIYGEFARLNFPEER